MNIIRPQVLKQEYVPQHIINREYENGVLTEAVSIHRPSNIYIHGSRGVGKTLITRTMLEQSDDAVSAYHVPCSKNDTQYKVLSHLHQQFTDNEIGSGYHTAQLQNAIREELTRDTVIVLDEVDFLLENDGNNLLYYLSRLQDGGRPSVIAVSSYHRDLLAMIDERTYSSLHPRHLSFSPYSEEVFCKILTDRIEQAFKPRSVEPDAVDAIASATTNLQLALQWLEVASHSATGRVAEDDIWETKTAAIQQYWDVLLQEFSIHHHLLLEAITQLSEGGRLTVYTGEVYDRYDDVCGTTGKKPLTHRRTSDFIRHLELLGIVDAEYYYGGKKGKTREIRLKTY